MLSPNVIVYDYQDATSFLIAVSIQHYCYVAVDDIDNLQISKAITIGMIYFIGT
jgi:hypothetical protein